MSNSINTSLQVVIISLAGMGLAYSAWWISQGIGFSSTACAKRHQCRTCIINHVSMCTCVVHNYAYICACMCTCLCVCVRACMRANHVSMCTCVVHMHTYVHACVRACVCVCVHACMRACMRACVCIMS